MENKFNEKGKEMLNFKQELLKGHSPIVYKALIQSLEDLVSRKIIDLNTFNLLKNKDVSLEEFENYLKTKEEFLNSEYIYLDSFKDKVFYYLSNNFNIEKLKVEAEDNYVTIIKTYSIDVNFLLQEFDVTLEEADTLLKQKSFIEKYAILKLEKIAKDIKVNNKIKIVEISSDYVYFLKNERSYNIDVMLKFSIDKCKNDKDFRRLMRQIANTITL